MQEIENGKDLILISPEVPARQRSKPTLVQIGKRMVTSDGRYHVSLVADYLLSRGRKEWILVAELAKIFCGAATIDGKKRVRKNMFHVFTALLNRGEFLVYETLPNGRINAVKLFDAKSEQERQAADHQAERMRQRHQLSTAKYDHARQVLELQRELHV